MVEQRRPKFLIKLRAETVQPLQTADEPHIGFPLADSLQAVADAVADKGVEVSAEGNPQMMLYALGALELFDGIYDIDTVRMAIYQPRREKGSFFYPRPLYPHPR